MKAREKERKRKREKEDRRERLIDRNREERRRL
jgi:hypothetical protein